MAHNMSETAYASGKKARAMQKEMFAKLSEMNNNMLMAMNLARSTSSNVEVVTNITKGTLMEAKLALKEANESIPDLGLKVIQGKCWVSSNILLSCNL